MGIIQESISTIKKTSAIDITLCTMDLEEKITSDTQEELLGSDHIPILIKLEYNHQKVKEVCNWEKTINQINRKMDENKGKENIEEIITRTIEKNTKTIKINGKHIPKPWWNSKLQRLWKIKQENFKCYNKEKTLYTGREFIQDDCRIEKRNQDSKKSSLGKICIQHRQYHKHKRIMERTKQTKIQRRKQT